jgi:threonine dehydratase
VSSLWHLLSGEGPDAAPIAPEAGAAFVHLCRSDQLDAVRRRFFFGRSVTAIEIDPSRLDASKLKEEDLYGHGAHPHYFGVVPVEAIIGAQAIGPVTLSDVEAALPIVRRHFPPTPLVFARRLSARLDREIWLKLDALTPIRTFKIRGALVKVDSIAKSATGVVTASAGNHGLAVAWAARRYDLPATIVVPESANPEKVAAIRAERADVIHHGADYQAASDHAQRIAEERSFTMVHAYDDPSIIAGQGTLGLEIESADTVAVGIGGGGLISGLGVALKGRFPALRLFGAQPEGADSMARSLASGEITSIDRVTTIADGLGARRPGLLTLALTKRYVERVLRVSDAALIEALRILLRDERIIGEPAGIAGLAAILAEPEIASGKIVLPITGANVSDRVLEEITR